MRRSLLTVAILFVTVGGIGAQQRNDPTEDLEKRASVIRPSAGELKWQQIPWLLDLTEGQKLAATENRPIFLWATGDDPLERC